MILALALAAIIAGAIAIIHPRIRITIITGKDIDMGAIDNLNAAVASVGAYVTTLQSDLASVDLSPQIQAAADALNALVPPAVEATPAPVAEPEPGVTA